MSKRPYRTEPLYTTPNLGIIVISERTYIHTGKLRVLCHVRPHPAVHGILIYRARLVMTDHLGRRLLSSEIVHHRDEDRTEDDSLDNLKLMTRGEHQREHRLGRKQRPDTVAKKILGMHAAWKRGAFANATRRGSDMPGAKIKEDDALFIRQLAFAGYKQCDIARELGLSQGAVSSIVNYKTWRHV